MIGEIERLRDRLGEIEDRRDDREVADMGLVTRAVPDVEHQGVLMNLLSEEFVTQSAELFDSYESCETMLAFLSRRR